MSKRIKHDVGLYVLDEVKQKKLALPGTNVEYDLKRNWRKVRRHIEHPQVQALLVRDFNRCTWGRWRIITSKSSRQSSLSY